MVLHLLLNCVSNWWIPCHWMEHEEDAAEVTQAAHTDKMSSDYSSGVLLMFPWSRSLTWLLWVQGQLVRRVRESHLCQEAMSLKVVSSWWPQKMAQPRVRRSHNQHLVEASLGTGNTVMCFLVYISHQLPTPQLGSSVEVPRLRGRRMSETLVVQVTHYWNLSSGKW